MENSCKENLKQSSKKWVLASVYPKFRRNLCLRSTNADLYHYAGNCPVRYIDPDGRETKKCKSFMGMPPSKIITIPAKVSFVYTYKDSHYDQIELKSKERNSINEEVQSLEDKGIQVNVFEYSSRDDILYLLEKDTNNIIIFSGHGYPDGTIQTSDKCTISPSDVKKLAPFKNLKVVIFENCHQGGKNKKNWEEAFGKDVVVIAWKGKTSAYETRRFNNSGFLDRQKNNLQYYIELALPSFFKENNSNEK